MAGKKESKNNPGQRWLAQKVRMLDGKKVIPVMLGDKRRMVGQIDGEIVRDRNGTPIPLKQIGVLV